MTPAELTARRVRLGLSQAALARRLGLARRDTVHRWEHGARPVPGYLALALDALEQEHDMQTTDVRIGDTVVYDGERRRVNSVKARGIAAPLLRLDGVEGLVSHVLVSQLERERKEHTA